MKVDVATTSTLERTCGKRLLIASSSEDSPRVPGKFCPCSTKQHSTRKEVGVVMADQEVCYFEQTTLIRKAVYTIPSMCCRLLSLVWDFKCDCWSTAAVASASYAEHDVGCLSVAMKESSRARKNHIATTI